MTKISTDKTYRTKDGKDVVIFTTTAIRSRPVVGQLGGDSYITSWYEDGSYETKGSSPMDLVEVMPKHVQWVNVYSFGVVACDTREEADKGSSSGRIACLRIEFTEGEGLTGLEAECGPT